jgi:hypothetical protein
MRMEKDEKYFEDNPDTRDPWSKEQKNKTNQKARKDTRRKSLNITKCGKIDQSLKIK